MFHCTLSNGTEATAVSAKGEEIPVEISISTFHASKQPVEFIVVMRDILPTLHFDDFFSRFMTHRPTFWPSENKSPKSHVLVSMIFGGWRKVVEKLADIFLIKILNFFHFLTKTRRKTPYIEFRVQIDCL